MILPASFVNAEYHFGQIGNYHSPDLIEYLVWMLLPFVIAGNLVDEN